MLDQAQLRRQTAVLTGGDESSRQEAVRSLEIYEERDWVGAPADVPGPLVEALPCQLVERGEGPRPFGFPPPFRQDVAAPPTSASSVRLARLPYPPWNGVGC
jgi:hypothetical protein